MGGGGKFVHVCYVTDKSERKGVTAYQYNNKVVVRSYVFPFRSFKRRSVSILQLHLLRNKPTMGAVLLIYTNFHSSQNNPHTHKHTHEHKHRRCHKFATQVATSTAITFAPSIKPQGLRSRPMMVESVALNATVCRPFVTHQTLCLPTARDTCQSAQQKKQTLFLSRNADVPMSSVLFVNCVGV